MRKERPRGISLSVKTNALRQLNLRFSALALNRWFRLAIRGLAVRCRRAKGDGRSFEIINSRIISDAHTSMTNLGHVFNLPKLLFKYAQMVKLGNLLPLVASACGSANGKVKRSRRDDRTEPERNDRRRAAGESTPIIRIVRMPL